MIKVYRIGGSLIGKCELTVNVIVLPISELTRSQTVMQMKF